jgi:hypothetical protein
VLVLFVVGALWVAEAGSGGGAPVAQAIGGEQMATAPGTVLARDLDVLSDGNLIYYSTSGQGEFCVSGDNRVNRLTFWGGTSPGDPPGEVSQQACPDAASVAGDGVDVYYAVDTEVRRRRAIPLGISDELITTSATPITDLIVDANYVWFTNDSGLYRSAKLPSSTASSHLAGLVGKNAWDLAQDDTYVYIANDFGLQRALKSMGSSSVQVKAGVIYGVAENEEYVFWTESTGRVGRAYKPNITTSELEVVAANPGYRGGEIGVHDDVVYWLEIPTGAGTASLRRRYFDGSGPNEIMAFSLTSAASLDVSSRYVFWTDGDGVWRLAHGAAPPVLPDLTIAAVEVTQVIQDLANSVPLVQDKFTMVRVYPETTIMSLGGVAAELRACRVSGSSSLPACPTLSAPIAPINGPPMYVKASGYDRSQFGDSYNFVLPPSWLAGTIQLTATIDPANVFVESNNGNNTNSPATQVTFTNKYPRCMRVYPVWTSPQTASVNDPDFWPVIDWFEASWPFDEIRINRGDRLEEDWWPFENTYEVPSDSSGILDTLTSDMIFANDPDACNDDQWHFGLVHLSETGTQGAARRGEDVAWGVINANPPGINNGQNGGSVMSHEIGHADDRAERKHMNCGAFPSDQANFNRYAYTNPCDLGPNDAAGYFGFDSLTSTVIPPTSAADIMSYAHLLNALTPPQTNKPRWPYDVAYRAFFNAVPNQGGGGGGESIGDLQLASPTGEYLAVKGTLGPAAFTGAIQPGQMLPAGTVEPARLTKLLEDAAPGPYRVRLVDASDVTLAERWFMPGESDGDDPAEPLHFTVFVPFDSAATEIVLTQGTTELDRQAISANAPTVTVTSPNGGESLSAPFNVTWTANDVDADQLRYTVQYSPDGGATWYVLDRTQNTTITVDEPRLVPGSTNARIRVLASDGVRVGMDTSNASFTLAKTGPETHITRPLPNESYDTGERIVLMGRGIDAEDVALSGAGLEWRVDSVFKGTGRILDIGTLSVGKHTAQLRGIDSNGNQVNVTADFFVGDCDVLQGDASEQGCFTHTGLWHLESAATISGMTNPTLAFNQGCTGPGTTGCNYNTGGTVQGRTQSATFTPLTGATLIVKSARETESGCGSFDRTFIEYSTDSGATFTGLPLAGASIDSGGQYFGGTAGEICGNSLTPQLIMAPLPAGTTNIAFRFDSADAIDNAFDGWFVDIEGILCIDDQDRDNVCGAEDNCPDSHDPTVRDNDSDGLGDACDSDDDNDALPDTSDNCGYSGNGSQTNNDRNFNPNQDGSVNYVDDLTVVMSDDIGDACDPDDDNDGIEDGSEQAGPSCGTGATNQLVADSDGDRVVDPAECILGTDPMSAASKPAAAACGSTVDTDGDRLSDRVEFCGYGSDPSEVDSDGDATSTGARDGCEAASLNADRVVNAGDQLLMGLEIARAGSSTTKLVNFDINKDGGVNAGDQLVMATLIAPPGQCP